jgi:uncharacterized protein YuzE
MTVDVPERISFRVSSADAAYVKLWPHKRGSSKVAKTIRLVDHFVYANGDTELYLDIDTEGNLMGIEILTYPSVESEAGE